MVERFRVLHLGNPANVAAELRDASEAEGLAESLVVETSNTRLSFDEDMRVGWEWTQSSFHRLERRISVSLLLDGLLAEADVVHVHSSGRLSLLCQRRARARGVKVVRHLHGQDARIGNQRAELRFADAVLVSTPDLLPFVKPFAAGHTAVWMPNPHRFPEECPDPPSWDGTRIVHAYLPGASYLQMYGTQDIRAAVKNLQQKGHKVVLEEVSGVPHHEALRRYAEADLAVDKIYAGWYGVFSVECIGMGVPSIAGISGSLAYLNPPVLAVGDTGLESTIEPLVADRGLRKAIARRLFSAAKALHSHTLVARRVRGIYERLMTGEGVGLGRH